MITQTSEFASLVFIQRLAWTFREDAKWSATEAACDLVLSTFV